MADLPRLFDDLIRWETKLWNRVDTRLRDEVDLPLSRLEPMQVIERLGPCRVNDIVRELSISIGGASKLVDRIEAAGLCQRRSDPEDGRSALITLTPPGRRLLARATAVFHQELQVQVGSVLSPSELDAFAATLARLRAHQTSPMINVRRARQR